MRILALTFALLATTAATLAQDPDRDGDGLGDFHEVHKYRTDPERADSDGDGVPDGDWLERRQFQYVVRSVVQVMKPVTVAFLDDDYQDVRVLDETADHVELEVIHYPFNTVATTITADPHWRKTAAAMAEWTAPGPTSDWTPQMRDELVAALRADGIDRDGLDDVTLVQRASHWLLQRAEYHDGFSTFVTDFDDQGRPFVPEELRGDRTREQLEAQWPREISARGMFEHRQRGSCTSSAIYLSGCLRALGVPTRTVLCIPVIDASDDGEQALLGRLQHNGVRKTLQGVMRGMRQSWASHTFNEVFVGHRWRRLNYDKLGQNTYDPGLFGLMTHVATFRDWADADMPATVGRRQKSDQPADVFGGRNPYSTIALRDEFGPHCALTNPPADVEQMSIAKVVWTDGPELSDDMRESLRSSERFGLIVCLEGLASSEAFRDFVNASDHRVLLEAQGQPTLGVGFDPRCYWYDNGAAWIYVPFGAGDRRDLVRGVEYAFRPRNAHAGLAWVVPADLRVVRQRELPK